MSEKMRESLSALMDDEANELEIERVLSRIADDPELRQAVEDVILNTDPEASERLAHVQERNPDAYQRELKAWKLSSRIQQIGRASCRERV